MVLTLFVMTIIGVYVVLQVSVAGHCFSIRTWQHSSHHVEVGEGLLCLCQTFQTSSLPTAPRYLSHSFLFICRTNCTCIYFNIHLHSHAHTHTYTHTHTHTHTHIYTYTHVQIHVVCSVVVVCFCKCAGRSYTVWTTPVMYVIDQCIFFLTSGTLKEKGNIFDKAEHDFHS